MERQLPPADNLPARCVQIIDCGTQEEEWEGVKSSKRKLRVTWELPTVEFTSQDGETYNPIISREYTASLHEKSILRPMLEAWRGRAFSSDELDDFEITKLLNATCLIQVAHKEKRTGGQCAVIANVSKLPKGMKCPERQRALSEYSASEGDSELYRTLPDWLKDKIALSPEWQEVVKKNGAPQSTRADHVPDDEVPF
jgi:hypothetical protein